MKPTDVTSIPSLPITITEYRFGTDADARSYLAVYVTYKNNNLYAVWRVRGEVFDIDENEIYEPSPSNRDDEFLSKTRFDLNTALAMARKIYCRLIEKDL